MDPITIYRLGLIRQQEFLESAQRQQDEEPARHYISEFGSLLVRAGQKLVDVAKPTMEQPVASQPIPECC